MDVCTNPMYDDFTGFSFNGQHSSQFGLLRVSDGDRYRDSLVLPHSDEAADIPGGPGKHYWGETLKARDFNVKIAYDNVTEVDKRRIKRWLHPDDKLHELIFDEKPYVKYWVKCSKEVTANEVCFMENNTRIYKGEFDIVFTAYMPYGIAVAKTYDDIGDPEKREEWRESSGLMTNSEQYSNSIDSFSSSNVYIYKTRVYNPGDIETGFKLGFNFPAQRNELEYKNIVTTNTGYQILKGIITNDSVGSFYILRKDGAFRELTKTSFPFYTYIYDDNKSAGQGQIITEGQVSKFESFVDGKIYDIYKSVDNIKHYTYEYKNSVDFGYGWGLYGIDNNNNYYKIQIDSKDNTNKKVVIQFTEATFSNSPPKTLYIAKSIDIVLTVKYCEGYNSTTAIKSFTFKFPAAATINPEEWTEVQKALFYSSMIIIDTNKKTINYKISDSTFTLNFDWNGIMGIIN